MPTGPAAVEIVKCLYADLARDSPGRHGGVHQRLQERTVDRDKAMSVEGFQTQLMAIWRFARSAPSDLSVITQPTLIANGDNDRMVPTVLSEDLHRRIKGSELVIYPDSGHGGIFQYHEKVAPLAVEFLGRRVTDDEVSRQASSS